MLCGIGGKTIEEAQRNLTVEEIGIWLAYREKMGGLSIIDHIDYQGAQVSQLTLITSGATSRQYKLEDFSRIRFKQSDRVQVPLTPQALMRGLRGNGK